MTEERIIVTLKDDGEYSDKQPDNEIVLDGWFKYELAPPKDWTPFCFGNYQGVGDESCIDCPKNEQCHDKTKGLK